MILIFFLFVIALGVKLFSLNLAQQTLEAAYSVSPDGLLYTNIAENFLNGKGLVNTVSEDPTSGFRNREYVVGPIYPLFLALIYGIFGLKNYSAVILAQAVLAALTAVLAFKIGEEFFGKKWGIIPYLLILGYPVFTYWNLYVLTETLYVFIITLFLYILVLYFNYLSKPSTRLKILLVMGFIMGLSNLTRPLLLIAYPVILFWMIWVNGWRLKIGFRDFGIFLLVSLIIMSPWWVRNYLKYNQLIVSTNYGAYELYVGNNPKTVTDDFFYFAAPSYDPEVKARIDKLPVLEQEKEYSKLAKSYVLEHPVGFVERTLTKAKKLFWQPVSKWYGEYYKMYGYTLDSWYLWLGLAGAVVSLFQLRKYSFLLLLTLYYSFSVSMITIVSGARYRLPIMPAVILLGSVAIVYVLKGGVFLIQRFALRK
jgi:4-amino-4-deoxy-L-arabinose transferase-like glycosyltransferase